MSIVQNLKLLNKPISELAMLPQEAIIQMAQAGQIPTAFVAPILGEKAEQAKAGANAAAMMAQQEVPPTTVLEGIMAQNAANQAVESMPAMPMGQETPMGLPEEMGIGALPVSEDMVPEFAGGGIIAFQNRGLVDSFDYNAATRDIDAASGGIDYSQFGGLGEELRRQEELRRMYLGDNTAVQTELAGMGEAAQQQRAMRLLEAGLGIMGGESPYALSNIAKGAQPALRGYAEDVAAQRKRRAELAGMERAEKAGVLGEAQKRTAEKETLASREKQSELDRLSRERVAAMPGETERIAAQIRKEAAANGEKISAEDAARRAKAALTAPPDRYNALSNRLSAANKDIATRTSILQQQLSTAKTAKDKKAIQDQIDAVKNQVLSDYSITPADLAELQAAGRVSTPTASGAAAPRSAGFSVTAPDGKIYSFPTQQAADEFRRRIQGQ
jgi:hypothetical protein